MIVVDVQNDFCPGGATRAVEVTSGEAEVAVRELVAAGVELVD